MEDHAMEAAHFDRLTLLLAGRDSRRTTLAGLLSGMFGLFGAWTDEATAKNCKKIKNKKKRKKCLKKKAKPCVPDCAGKVCGDDGCGGSCGTCTDLRTCQGGQCACLAVECNGACVAACGAGQARDPRACSCCLVNGSIGCDPDPTATPCCSGYCLSGPPGSICVGRGDSALCDFDAQCASGECISGFNGSPSTCFGS
jgi:hypothetical protein